MKKSIKHTFLMIAGAAMVSACGLFGPKSDIKGFQKTESGLHYKFEKTNKDGQQVKMGDVIQGEMIFRLDTNVLFDTKGDPQRLFMVKDSVFNGYDIDEGLLMMHEGEKATFAIFADSVANYFQPSQMPPTYKAGTGQIFYYELTITGIITKQELEQEQANFMTEMAEREASEPESIAQYIADNNITAKPNADGLYIIVNKKGSGPKVAAGKNVAINYTGRTLEGTMFDSSIEADAKEGGIYMQQRPYEPLTYEVGKMSLIKGWEDGIMGQPAGSQLTLIIPSALAYGAQGAGRDILPYTPLRFDIEIVSVQ